MNANKEARNVHCTLRLDLQQTRHIVDLILFQIKEMQIKVK